MRSSSAGSRGASSRANDAGEPFDDEAPVETVFEVTNEWLIEQAEVAIRQDPLGICRDVMIMDETAAVLLIKVGAEENDGVNISAKQAQVIFDHWVAFCEGDTE